MRLLKRLLCRFRRDKAHYCEDCAFVLQDTNWDNGDYRRFKYGECTANTEVSSNNSLYLCNDRKRELHFYFCTTIREISERNSKYCSRYKREVK